MAYQFILLLWIPGTGRDSGYPVCTWNGNHSASHRCQCKYDRFCETVPDDYCNWCAVYYVFNCICEYSAGRRRIEGIDGRKPVRYRSKYYFGPDHDPGAWLGSDRCSACDDYRQYCGLSLLYCLLSAGKIDTVDSFP